MHIPSILWIALAGLAILLVGGAAGLLLGRRYRTRQLQQTFGPEYEHTVEQVGDQQQAEQELITRLKHVKALEIRPLTLDEVKEFQAKWHAMQAQFVDEPLTALQQADQLIAQVMATKGYPVEDFEQQVADISVDYPELVMDYRGLHLIALKGSDEPVTTEEMRQAMLHGRTLFDKLMQRDEPVTATVTEEV